MPILTLWRNEFIHDLIIQFDISKMCIQVNKQQWLTPSGEHTLTLPLLPELLSSPLSYRISFLFFRLENCGPSFHRSSGFWSHIPIISHDQTHHKMMMAASWAKFSLVQAGCTGAKLLLNRMSIAAPLLAHVESYKSLTGRVEHGLLDVFAAPERLNLL